MTWRNDVTVTYHAIFGYSHPIQTISNSFLTFSTSQYNMKYFSAKCDYRFRYNVTPWRQHDIPCYAIMGIAVGIVQLRCIQAVMYVYLRFIGRHLEFLIFALIAQYRIQRHSNPALWKHAWSRYFADTFYTGWDVSVPVCRPPSWIYNSSLHHTIWRIAPINSCALNISV